MTTVSRHGCAHRPAVAIHNVTRVNISPKLGRKCTIWEAAGE